MGTTCPGRLQPAVFAHVSPRPMCWVAWMFAVVGMIRMIDFGGERVVSGSELGKEINKKS